MRASACWWMVDDSSHSKPPPSEDPCVHLHVDEWWMIPLTTSHPPSEDPCVHLRGPRLSPDIALIEGFSRAVAPTRENAPGIYPFFLLSPDQPPWAAFTSFRDREESRTPPKNSWKSLGVNSFWNWSETYLYPSGILGGNVMELEYKVHTGQQQAIIGDNRRYYLSADYFYQDLLNCSVHVVFYKGNMYRWRRILNG